MILCSHLEKQFGAFFRLNLHLWILKGLSVKKKKDPSASAGDVGDAGSVPESGGSPGGGNVNPLQHSCRENPVNR